MFSEESKRLIAAHVKSLPTSLKESEATEEEIAHFESIHGKIPDDFRWFLRNCGSGIFGSERVDGISALFKSHEKFKKESKSPRGWTLKDFFLIGWDGSGNPFGIDLRTCEIVIEDHNFGDKHRLAGSLEEFMLKGIWKK
jgi:hypothetical protein